MHVRSLLTILLLLLPGTSPGSGGWFSDATAINSETNELQAASKSGWFEASPEGDAISVRADAPPGNYMVDWRVPREPGWRAMLVQGSLFRTSADQLNVIRISDGGDWTEYGRDFPPSQTVDLRANTLLLNDSESVHLRWVFHKTRAGETGDIRLSGFSLSPGDEAAALREFRLPLADGLPPLADPLTSRKPWNSRIELRDGMLLKDGQPFFPIGYVFGTGERPLAQAAAMGCNAVHFGAAWEESQGPGAIPSERFADSVNVIRRAADWGIASFPMLDGHHVPKWFSDQFPREKAGPLGNDGQMTGHWFEYSIHYPPFREHVVSFWQSATPLWAAEPSVVGINLWNEPSYGGVTNKTGRFADYSEWSIEGYRQYLQQKYGDLQTLRAAHRQAYAGFDAIAPPRQPDELGRVAWLDWMEFGQKAFADFFQREREVIRAAAPAARLVNKKQNNPADLSAASSGTNWHLMGQSEDIFGLNLYPGSVVGARDNFDMARSFANGKPVMVFETNAMPPNAAGRTPDVVRCQLWAQVVGGARGMFIFSMDPSDPSHGLLNDQACSPQARREYVRFTQNIAAHQRELASPQVPAKIAVLYSTTGVLQRPQREVSADVLCAYYLFRNSHYQTDFLPQERCTTEELARYELLVVPSYAILKATELEVIDAFVAGGGKAICFAASLATDEYLEPIAPPAWMGIVQRRPPPGGRASQKILHVEPDLQPFVEADVDIQGFERVGAGGDGDDEPVLQGAAIESHLRGIILATTSDGYPAIMQSQSGSVIYCAFEPHNSEPLRALIESITRLRLGIHQQVRITRSDKTETGLLVGHIQDYAEPSTRYLLVLNTLRQAVRANIELEAPWRVLNERLHNLPIPESGSSVVLPSRDACLFTLKQ